MLFYEFNAGNKDYKLRLNTRNIVQLESKLGCNPIMVFGVNGDVIPTVATMVTILHASLQQLQHGITYDEAYNIFDAYLEDGHASIDFIKDIMEIYKVSGIVPKDNKETEETEKN